MYETWLALDLEETDSKSYARDNWENLNMDYVDHIRELLLKFLRHDNGVTVM